MRRSQLLTIALRAHWRLAPGLVVLWLISLAGSVLLPIGSAVLLGAVVGAAARGVEYVVVPLVALAAVDLLHAPCKTYGWVLCWTLGRRYRLAHKQRIMRALLDPPGVAHMHAPETLDAAHASDNAWVVNMLEGVNNVVVARLTGVGGLVIVAVHQPVAAAVLFVSWAVMGKWRWRRASVSSQVWSGQAQTFRRSEAMSDLALAPAAAKEIRLFGLREWLGARYATEWLAAMNRIWAERKSAARGATAIALLLLGGHAIALWLIARDAVAGHIGIGALAAVLLGVLMAREVGEGVMGGWELDYGLPLVARVAALERVVQAESEPIEGTRPPPGLVAGIRFEAVEFRYPGATRDVLRGVDLDIPAGSSLAIVGENGAGKTTVVQLLARLRDPTGGRITVDGVDLREIEPSGWHDLVAAVSQEAVRLPLTVADNIGAGRTSDRNVLDRAIAGAGAGAIVDSLTLGWETPLAKGLESGADLSGGQWQRLALARGLAALECGAKVLVLDEPTAHLDVRAEAELYDRFLELTRGSTTVLVSHRFSTVRRADRIAVLADGVVVEHGSHEELIRAGGRYARMFQLQASRFTEGPS